MESEVAFYSKKEVLIKSVAQSLSSYAMSVFLLPIEMSEEMEQMMCKFWWRKSGAREIGIHWMRVME